MAASAVECQSVTVELDLDKVEVRVNESVGESHRSIFRIMQMKKPLDHRAFCGFPYVDLRDSPA